MPSVLSSCRSADLNFFILIGCLCSIATEATQYLLKMGWCETDDVIHNTLGTVIGVWVWLWQSKRLNAQRSANPGKGET